MKQPNVCKGCKHLINRKNATDLKRFCDYMENTGKSRLVIEMQNGGYKTDSCICYEEGIAKRRKRKSIEI